MEAPKPFKNETLKDFINRYKDNYTINYLTKIFIESLKKTKKTNEIILK